MLIEGQDDIPPLDAATSVSTPLKTLDPLTLKGEERNLAILQHYALCGSIVDTARKFGETAYGLAQLMATPWWQREYAFLRREQMAQENVRLTSLWSKTLDQIEDVLTYGEEVQTKHGDVVRKTLSASALARLAEVLFDKRQIVRNEPTVIVDNNSVSKLDELAQKLARLGQARTIENDSGEEQSWEKD